MLLTIVQVHNSANMDNNMFNNKIIFSWISIDLSIIKILAVKETPLENQQQLINSTQLHNNIIFSFYLQINDLVCVLFQSMVFFHFYQITSTENVELRHIMALVFMFLFCMCYAINLNLVVGKRTLN